MKDFALRLALSGALLAAVSACGSGAGTGATPAPDLVTKPVIGSLDADSNGWAGLAIVDVKRFTDRERSDALSIVRGVLSPTGLVNLAITSAAEAVIDRQ